MITSTIKFYEHIARMNDLNNTRSLLWYIKKKKKRGSFKTSYVINCRKINLAYIVA